MMQITEPFNKNDYIVTTSGNKIARQAIIKGSEHIVLGGKVVIKPKAILHGDLYSSAPGVLNMTISINSLSIIEQSVELIPPKQNNDKTYSSLKIGQNVYIGQNCKINASSIGDNVYIGENSILGNKSVIESNVIIQPNTIVPPDTTIGPFTIAQKSIFGLQRQHLSESWCKIWPLKIESYYSNFV